MLSDDTIQQIIQSYVHFHFSKSGGPGGQHVNKRMTKAELYFNIDACVLLSAEQKQQLKDLAGSCVHHDSSTLILTCQEERYQYANKTRVLHRFITLLHQACDTPIERIPTQAPAYIQQQKKSHKIHQGRKKDQRRAVDPYQE